MASSKYSPQRPGDRGALDAGLYRLPGMRQLALDFGTTLSWVASTPADAHAQATAMRAVVQREWGTVSYSLDDLPIRLDIDWPTNQILSHLPESCRILVAQPEVWLAWAHALDRAANALEGATG